MVIDSSALLAIVLDEPERQTFLSKISLDARPLIAAANYVEAAIVLVSRRGPAAAVELRGFLEEAGIEIAEVNDAVSEAAIEAFARFGKGRHPAGLNFGDCFAYALASIMGERLLYKGDDFAKTDIDAA